MSNYFICSNEFCELYLERLRVYEKKQRDLDKPIESYRFPFISLIFHVSFRYLAGRFPETTNAIDVNGRTPLHYAATLADNGHYYNLLLHLGANPLTQDNVSMILFLSITSWQEIIISNNTGHPDCKKVTGFIESRFKQFSLNLENYLLSYISCVTLLMTYI